MNAGPFAEPPTDAQLAARQAMCQQVADVLRGCDEAADAVSVCISLAAGYLLTAPSNYRLQITLEAATLLVGCVRDSLETRH
jgi:hypothetical protein